MTRRELLRAYVAVADTQLCGEFAVERVNVVVLASALGVAVAELEARGLEDERRRKPGRLRRALQAAPMAAVERVAALQRMTTFDAMLTDFRMVRCAWPPCDIRVLRYGPGTPRKYCCDYHKKLAYKARHQPNSTTAGRARAALSKAG